MKIGRQDLQSIIWTPKSHLFGERTAYVDTLAQLGPSDELRDSVEPVLSLTGNETVRTSRAWDGKMSPQSLNPH
jgi:hypothetical protein